VILEDRASVLRRARRGAYLAVGGGRAELRRGLERALRGVHRVAEGWFVRRVSRSGRTVDDDVAGGKRSVPKKM
jgi:hypothetical protein